MCTSKISLVSGPRSRKRGSHQVSDVYFLFCLSRGPLKLRVGGDKGRFVREELGIVYILRGPLEEFYVRDEVVQPWPQTLRHKDRSRVHSDYDHQVPTGTLIFSRFSKGFYGHWGVVPKWCVDAVQVVCDPRDPESYYLVRYASQVVVSQSLCSRPPTQFTVSHTTSTPCHRSIYVNKRSKNFSIQ